MEKIERKLLYKGVYQDYYEYPPEKVGDKINEIVEFLNKQFPQSQPITPVIVNKDFVVTSTNEPMTSATSDNINLKKYEC